MRRFGLHILLALLFASWTCSSALADHDAPESSKEDSQDAPIASTGSDYVNFVPTGKEEDCKSFSAEAVCKAVRVDYIDETVFCCAHTPVVGPMISKLSLYPAMFIQNGNDEQIKASLPELEWLRRHNACELLKQENQGGSKDLSTDPLKRNEKYLQQTFATYYPQIKWLPLEEIQKSCRPLEAETRSTVSEAPKKPYGTPIGSETGTAAAALKRMMIGKEQVVQGIGAVAAKMGSSLEYAKDVRQRAELKAQADRGARTEIESISPETRRLVNFNLGSSSLPKIGTSLPITAGTDLALGTNGNALSINNLLLGRTPDTALVDQSPDSSSPSVSPLKVAEVILEDLGLKNYLDAPVVKTEPSNPVTPPAVEVPKAETSPAPLASNSNSPSRSPAAASSQGLRQTESAQDKQLVLSAAQQAEEEQNHENRLRERAKLNPGKAKPIVKSAALEKSPTKSMVPSTASAAALPKFSGGASSLPTASGGGFTPLSFASTERASNEATPFKAARMDESGKVDGASSVAKSAGNSIGAPSSDVISLRGKISASGSVESSQASRPGVSGTGSAPPSQYSYAGSVSSPSISSAFGAKASSASVGSFTNATADISEASLGTISGKSGDSNLKSTAAQELGALIAREKIQDVGEVSESTSTNWALPSELEELARELSQGFSSASRKINGKVSDLMRTLASSMGLSEMAKQQQLKALGKKGATGEQLAKLPVAHTVPPSIWTRFLMLLGLS